MTTFDKLTHTQQPGQPLDTHAAALRNPARAAQLCRLLLVLLVAVWLLLGGSGSPVSAQTLFGATSDSNSSVTSILYTIDATTGTATAVGTGIGFYGVSAMDFHPVTGMLYATGNRLNIAPAVRVLLTINPLTGVGTEIAPITIGITPINANISDISFRPSDNTLYAFTGAFTSPAHSVLTIDIATGAAILKGSSGLGGSGNGIAFSPGNVLFHADKADLHTLDQMAGTATTIAGLTGLNRSINSLDFHPVTGVLYGTDSGGQSSSTFLVTINTTTAVITTIGQTQTSIDALAWQPILNTAPTITPMAQTAAAGSPAQNLKIATVTDAETAVGSLTVSVTSANPANGVTLSNITNTGGMIFADVVAACGATSGSFMLQVSDGSLSGTGTLNVTVTANTPPALTYVNPAALVSGGGTTVNPATGPSDNGTVNDPIAVQSKGTFTGTVSVNNATGVVTISNAAPVGTHTITIRATDNCGGVGGMTDATFMLTVNKANTTTAITADTPDPSVTGQSVTVNYTVTPVAPGAGTPTGNVTVNASTGESCTATVAAGSCTIIFNSAGPRTLTATYAGDANFNGSASAAAPHTVQLSANPPQNTLAKLFPDDPLVCTGASINGAFGQTNTTAAPASGRVFVTLQNLVATPGSVVCTLTPAAGGATSFCNIENGQPTWRGTLAAGQRLDVTYQAQIPEGVTIQVCSTASSQFPDVIGPVLSAAPFCININCPGTAGPGVLPDARSIINDGKPGSVLIYNIYTSSATGANFAAAGGEGETYNLAAQTTTTQNTRINITNTSTTSAVFVHLFFVDGSTCAVADNYLCLTANQTASFLAADLDPGTTGYLVAVAVDRTGCPIVFNHLLGDEYVKFAAGHAANLAAEAIAAIPGGLTFCDPGSDTALLRFDGLNYNALPHVVAVDNVPSRVDGNDTLLILNRLGGSLVSGAATLGTVVGILYDDAENALSFVFTAGSCQARGSLSNSFPRTAPRFEQFIPAGRSGWLKLYVPPLSGVSGAVLNLNTNGGGSNFNQGHNLHKLTLTNNMVYTIPVFPPSC